jgi:hypothetical protein
MMNVISESTHLLVSPPLLFSTLRFLGRPTGRGRSRRRVAAPRARRPRYPAPEFGPHHASREAQIGRAAVHVRDEVVLPDVELDVRTRDTVVGHNSLLPSELSAIAASGPHCRRAERPVSTSLEARRRVAPPRRVVRGSGRAAPPRGRSTNAVRPAGSLQRTALWLDWTTPYKTRRPSQVWLPYDEGRRIAGPHRVVATGGLHTESNG